MENEKVKERKKNRFIGKREREKERERERERVNKRANTA